MIRCSLRNLFLACTLIFLGLGLIVLGHLVAGRSAESATTSLALPQCRGCHGNAEVEVAQLITTSQAIPCDVCHESHVVVSSETEIRRRLVNVAADYRVHHDSQYGAMWGAYWGYTLDHSAQKLARAEALLAYLQLKYPRYHWALPLAKPALEVALTSTTSRFSPLSILHQPIIRLLIVDDDPPLPLLELILLCLPLYLLYMQQRRSPPASDDAVFFKLNAFCEKIAHPLSFDRTHSLSFCFGERIISPCYAD